MNSKQKGQRRGYGIEIIIIILIAICLVYLMGFADDKLDEIITSEREALLMQHDPDNPLHDELADSIVGFRPDACKMIEVFSSELKPIFRVQFKADENIEGQLDDYPDLMKLLLNNKEGHTTIEIGDEEEDVYFRWTDTTDGEKRLVIIYMSRPIVRNIWVFHLVCYTILILVFALLIVIQLRAHQEKVQRYKYSSDRVVDKLIH